MVTKNYINYTVFAFPRSHQFMKNNIFSFSLGFLMLSGVAIADTSKTSTTTTSKSTYDWTGVYVGGFVGGASGANVTSSTNGLIHDDIEAIKKNESGYSTSSSFIGGGTVGYNWQIPKTPYLIGLEGEYGYLGQSGSSETTAVGHFSSDTRSYNTQNKTTIGSNFGYGLVGGRLGYALDRSLFYVKSGAVFTQVSTTNSLTPAYIGPFNSNSTNSGGTTTGYAIGGGIEYAPSWYSNKHLTLKVEYLYFGIPTSSNSSGAFCGETCSPIYHNSTGGISTAKIGVNYKF